MTKKVTKIIEKKKEPTTKQVAIPTVSHETLTVLAKRYNKSLGEMVALLIDNCYDYGLFFYEESKDGKLKAATRIDRLEKQLKRTSDGMWAAISEIKKEHNEDKKICWEALDEIKKVSDLCTRMLLEVGNFIKQYK